MLTVSLLRQVANKWKGHVQVPYDGYQPVDCPISVAGLFYIELLLETR